MSFLGTGRCDGGLCRNVLCRFGSHAKARRIETCRESGPLPGPNAVPRVQPVPARSVGAAQIASAEGQFEVVSPEPVQGEVEGGDGEAEKRRDEETKKLCESKKFCIIAL